MSTLGSLFVLAALQVTLFSVCAAAVYLFARRRGPATGSWAAATSLAMLLGLTVLAFLPWPRWWNPPLGTTPSDWQPAAQMESPGRHSFDPTTAPGDSSSRNPIDRPRGVRMQSEQSVFWSQLWNALGEPTAHSGRQWQSVLGPLLLVGITLALMRFMVGLWAVHKYRTQTQEIADVGMNDLLQVLRAGLGCRRSIELRESPAISSPATVGWHNPLILLPTGWINWTNDERRVVLAHEVAHVERGDYLAWLIAQFTLALHFYHPLVYWLAGRLHTEQEMAADGRGALVAGGPQLYLTTLAHIALREDRGKVSWAARPFIPMHGTFMRRIEMLRSTRSLPSASLTWYARTVLIAALLTAGILAAGLRGPGGSAMADDPPATKTAGNSDAADDAALSLAYVPADPFAVVKVRPADMLGRASVASLRKGLEDDPQLRDLENVELVVGVIMEPPGRPRSTGPFDRVVLRARKAEDIIKLTSAIAPAGEPVKIGTKTYYKAPDAKDDAAQVYTKLDERTVLIASEKDMRTILNEPSSPRKDWADRWTRITRGDLAVMVDMQQVRKLIERQANAGPQGAAILAKLSPVAPLWEKSDRVFLGTNLEQGLGLEVTLTTSGADAAEKVQQTMQALLTLAANGLEGLRKQVRAIPDDQQAMVRMLLGAGDDLIKKAQVSRDGTVVTIRSSSDMGGVPAVAAVVMPAVAKAREATHRAQSLNNMKQIGLAMHMYYDTHKHLPPAVIVGPDGKTPHSWRVELLPYLDQNDLFAQYKTDQPWDSETNKKLLAKIPAVYRHPNNPPTSTSTAYFVLTGKQTLFSGAEGTKFEEVSDGLSNTIMTVEAERDVPWTKPEDIDYQEGKPLPKFGGWSQGGTFAAGFGDGSVRILEAPGGPHGLEEKTLRALITAHGGEPVPGGF